MAMTRCSMILPGLKVTTNFSGTSTCRPVRGFRAFLAARVLTWNTHEVPELDSSFLFQRLDDRVKRLLNDVFDLLLVEACLIGNRFHDLFLRHGNTPRGSG